MNTTTEHDTPTAWVGCLACYNSGRLKGRWITADDWKESGEHLPDVDGKYWTRSTYSNGSPFVACAKCGGDEFAVMDSENTPSVVGESLLIWSEWVEVWGGLSDDEVEAFLLFLDWQTGDDLDSLLDQHRENYYGAHDSFRDFALDHFRECVDIPDHLDRYLDADAIANDYQHDFSSARGASGFVHVWRDC